MLIIFIMPCISIPHDFIMSPQNGIISAIIFSGFLLKISLNEGIINFINSIFSSPPRLSNLCFRSSIMMLSPFIAWCIVKSDLPSLGRERQGKFQIILIKIFSFFSMDSWLPYSLSWLTGNVTYSGRRFYGIREIFPFKEKGHVN